MLLEFNISKYCGYLIGSDNESWFYEMGSGFFFFWDGGGWNSSIFFVRREFNIRNFYLLKLF